jgi:hypothetical protein
LNRDLVVALRVRTWSTDFSWSCREETTMHLTRGADRPCPFCRSGNVRLAEAGEHSVWWGATLTAIRRCNLCGRLFEPPASRGLAIGVALFGLAMTVSAAVGFVVEDAPLFGMLPGVARYALSALALYGGVCVLWAGVRGLRTPRQADPEERNRKRSL